MRSLYDDKKESALSHECRFSPECLDRQERPSSAAGQPPLRTTNAPRFDYKIDFIIPISSPPQFHFFTKIRSPYHSVDCHSISRQIWELAELLKVGATMARARCRQRRS